MAGYIGTDADNNLRAVALDGTTVWSTKINPDANGNATAVTPLYATDCGGAVVTSATRTPLGITSPGNLYTVDQNGNATDQQPDSGTILSWTGSLYGPAASNGPTFTSYAHAPVILAPSFWPFLEANATGNASSSDIPLITVFHDSGVIRRDGVHREIAMEITGPLVVLNFTIIQWVRGKAMINGIVPIMSVDILGGPRRFEFPDWTPDAGKSDNIEYPLLVRAPSNNRIILQDDAGIKGVDFPAVVNVSLQFKVGAYRKNLFPLIAPRLQDVKDPTNPAPTVTYDWGVAGTSVIVVP
jgi:hypothetical protein